MGSCLCSCQSIEMCPPSQGTWQGRRCALPSGPSSLPASGSGSQQAEAGSQGAPSCDTPRPACALCSLGALPQRPGSVDLTSGGGQEDSEEHRPPALAAGLRDWGDAHCAVGRSSGWRSPVGTG